MDYLGTNSSAAKIARNQCWSILKNFNWQSRRYYLPKIVTIQNETSCIFYIQCQALVSRVTQCSGQIYTIPGIEAEGLTTFCKHNDFKGKPKIMTEAECTIGHKFAWAFYPHRLFINMAVWLLLKTVMDFCNSCIISSECAKYTGMLIRLERLHIHIFFKSIKYCSLLVLGLLPTNFLLHTYTSRLKIFFLHT